MRGTVTPNSHQKRYGQYFSGEKVADLLVSLLPEDAVVQSVIDPMAGVGDLLCSALAKFHEVRDVLAVEIDPPIATRCAQKLAGVRVVNGDTFVRKEVVKPEGWDFVITNPPYVRYQLQDGADGMIGSGDTIRKNLCRQITRFRHLSPEDKALLLQLAKNYSGLSDMAVPSWILCAGLVKMGGLLAMVVPDTWLSREYAAPVQYMLTKCFDILTVAKDVNAYWFENALVRTCLVVARRRITSPLLKVSRNTRCLEFEATLVGGNSLVESMQYDGKIGTAALASLLGTQKDVFGKGYTATQKRTSDLFPHMLSGAGTAKWIQAEDLAAVESELVHPTDMLWILNGSTYSGGFVTLSDLHIKCGQGLRTGANDFFYLDIKAQTSDAYIVENKPWRSKPGDMVIPAHYIVKALQNRSQAKGLVVAFAELTTGLLYVQNEIRLEDAASCAEPAQYTIFEDVVSEYITDSERFQNARGQTFKDYSAVRPNERKMGDLYARFWYMLPALTPRHLPNLCMTRVNSTAPECIFVPQDHDAPIVVDANFVTMWGDEAESIKAAFALLNSTWTKCYLETLCTVMGGGALKLEATQLKKLRFPQYTKAHIQRLAELGGELIQSSAVDDALQEKIDQATLEPFPDSEQLREKIGALLQKKLSERGVAQ